MLQEAGASSVVGVDRDSETVEYARRRYGGEGVSFIQADACAPPAMPPFDLIVSFETIEHLDDPVRFLDVCRGLLVLSGVFIVSTPYRHRVRADGSPINPVHKQEWQTREFEALLH